MNLKNKILMVINNKKITYFLLFLLIISCQTQKVINTTKYSDLAKEEKHLVDSYLPKVKKRMVKDKNEIILLFQYNCFFDKSVIVNEIYSEQFPRKPMENHYGQKIINYNKNLGKIRIKLSDGKFFTISQKEGYDYVTICYNQTLKVLYIHYYDFLKLLIEE